MIEFKKRWLPLLSVAVLFGGNAKAELTLDDASFQEVVAPFFAKYCEQCHGPEKQKSKRRFDKLQFPVVDDNMLVDFQDALDLINLAEMPPEDEPQPSEEEVKKVVQWLTAAIEQTHAQSSSTGGETVLRRLNRREYLHTVSDLFRINLDNFDPTQGFPSDNEVHHLDNQGDALVTSGFLLDQYLLAADKVVEKALPPLEKPEVQTWVQNGNFQQGEFTGFIEGVEMREIVDSRMQNFRNSMRGLAVANDPKSLERSRKVALKQFEFISDMAANIPTHIRLYEHPRAQRHMGAYGYMSNLEEGVPHDGYYHLAFDATALYRQPSYENFAETRTDELMRVAVVPGDVNVGPLSKPQPMEPELAQFELKDDEVAKYSARIWLNKGSVPRFIYLNGSHKGRGANIEAGQFLVERDGLEELKTGNHYLSYGLEHGEVPQVRISHIHLRGPINDGWPTKTHRELLGGTVFDPSKNAANIRKFLTKAYRRPATDVEVDSILKVYQARVDQGIEPWQAYKDCIKAALCSPGFLYLAEQPKADTGELDPYAVASRLSTPRGAQARHISASWASVRPSRTFATSFPFTSGWKQD
ncbi:MAG: DUF1587 domain-containing protein, partial [Verrucomicrobiota bacterium]